MPVQVELSRIILCEISEKQAIYLREVGGIREFPIIIGIYEASCIDRRVKGYHPPRPLTHDLMSGIIHALEADFESVVITELVDETYYAKLCLRRNDNAVLEIDSRPSDAIAIAVTRSPAIPIYVTEEVLSAALADNNKPQG
ncbi:MAG: bifunctional nuclease family protein [Pirellulaceae bacterium]|nr:bifunctional nuclease family protein [Pirellulaceae bacterium]